MRCLKLQTHTQPCHNIKSSSIVLLSVSSVWIIDWIQEAQTGRPVHQVEDSYHILCASLSLSFSVSRPPSLPICFCIFLCLLYLVTLFSPHFVWSPRSSRSPALSLSSSYVHPSLPLSIPPSPLPLFPSLLIYWRTGTKNNHTMHASVIFKGVPSG